MSETTTPISSRPGGAPPALWPAAWVAHPESRKEPVGVTLFRRRWDLATVPAHYRVRVTADNRYRLFVNGVPVSSGPPRADVPHWRYDEMDLAPHLVVGANVVTAVVWFQDDQSAPFAQMGLAPGFLVSEHPDDQDAHALHTPGAWRCLRDPAYAFIPQTDLPYGTVTGWGERFDAAKHPWGWERPDFDDSAWSDPHSLAPGSPRGARDAPSPYGLVPNPLPPMEETLEPLAAVVRSEGVIVENHRLAPDAPITIPAGTKAVLLFDNARLTTAFPELTLEGGRGATVRLRYAEALWGGKNRNEKGNRNDIQHKVLRGTRDEFLPDGPRRTYRPLVWRCFRYLQIEIETDKEPMNLHNLVGIFTAYPFAERGRFAASDESLAEIWKVGVRTARLCAHETYMDCPYYEQLQYGGDTRIQCLVSYYAFGDDRLARNALVQLDDSRIPDGLTQSRYPSRLPQIIPPFSLWWIGMLHDFWMFRDDPAFVRALLPGTRAVLDRFQSHLRPDALLGPLPWWNFADWAPQFPDGVPPGAEDGGSAILSLQLALALREASSMEQAFGIVETARRYRATAKRICEGVHKSCWDAWHGSIADTPDKKTFSQHAGALALLTDTVSGAEAKTLAEKLLSDKGEHLAQATFYFRFYLHRALRHAGLGDRYLDWLEPWRKMPAIGLTTWAETPEPTRSDCHAWSAHPNADLLATVLGIEPESPGFAKVSITPRLGSLEWAAGVVPHPRGEIVAEFHQENGVLTAKISLPDGVTGVLSAGDKSRPLRPGPQSFSL